MNDIPINLMYLLFSSMYVCVFSIWHIYLIKYFIILHKILCIILIIFRGYMTCLNMCACYRDYYTLFPLAYEQENTIHLNEYLFKEKLHRNIST